MNTVCDVSHQTLSGSQDFTRTPQCNIQLYRQWNYACVGGCIKISVECLIDSCYVMDIRLPEDRLMADPTVGPLVKHQWYSTYASRCHTLGGSGYRYVVTQTESVNVSSQGTFSHADNSLGSESHLIRPTWTDHAW